MNMQVKARETSDVSSRYRRLTIGFCFLISCTVWMVGPTPSAAQEKAAAVAENNVTAESLLDKYVDALGGLEAHKKFKNTVRTGKIELVGMGIEGKLTIYMSAPNLMYSLTVIDGIGKMEEGSNGKIAWASDAMMGPRLKEGDELQVSLQAAIFNAEVKWRELFKEVKYLGKETVEETDCHKLLLTPHAGHPETWYLNAKTFLPTKRMTKMTTAMGDFPMESFPSDYREVNGIMIAHTERLHTGMQKITLKTETVKHNQEIPADRFDLPDTIKELLESDG